MNDIAAKLDALHNSIGFDEKKHRYKVGGVTPVPVTSVCDLLAKPALVPWAVKLTREGRDWREESKAARDLGTRVHQAAEEWVLQRMGLPVNPDPILHDTESAYLAAGLTAFLEKASSEIEFPFKPERRLYHPIGYAGTMDLPVMWKGQPTILDIKTGPKADTFYDEWQLQNSAYRLAARHHTGIEWFGGILLVAKDGSEPRIIPLGNDERDHLAFLNLLGVYAWKKRIVRGD